MLKNLHVKKNPFRERKFKIQPSLTSQPSISMPQDSREARCSDSSIHFTSQYLSWTTSRDWLAKPINATLPYTYDQKMIIQWYQTIQNGRSRQMGLQVEEGRSIFLHDLGADHCCKLHNHVQDHLYPRNKHRRVHRLPVLRRLPLHGSLCILCRKVYIYVTMSN